MAAIGLAGCQRLHSVRLTVALRKDFDTASCTKRITTAATSASLHYRKRIANAVVRAEGSRRHNLKVRGKQGGASVL